MVVVPAGSYRMGSPSGEQGRDDDEGPVREVTFGAPFALGVYEVTVAEFGRFVDETGYAAGSSCKPTKAASGSLLMAAAGATRASDRAASIRWPA